VLLACGPSEQELSLQRQVRELRGKLADQKQRADDLSVRVHTIRARNRVLISLVLGLTSESDARALAGTALPAPLGKAQQALAALDRDLDVLASSLKKTRTDFVELRSERNQLSQKLDRAMGTIAEAKKREQQAQARLDTFRDMLLRLRAMIEEAKLEVRVVNNRMLVQLPEAVLFESGRADVTRQGKELLDRLATVLHAIEGREFQVAGHTDNVPIRTWRYKSNWDLSAARAVNVTRYLIERGVAAARLSAAGYADTRPAQGAEAGDS
jgi:chemotaxis protein MotB